jgi:hypothetical protein
MVCLDMNISLLMSFYTASVIFSSSKVTKCGLLKTMNVAIFWVMAPSSKNANRRFGGTYHLHLQGRKSAEHEITVKHVDRQICLLIFDPEHGVGTFLRNVDPHTDYTARYILEDGNIHNYLFIYILQFVFFIFNLITCIRTTSWNTDDNKWRPYIKLHTCNGSVVLK